MNTKLLLIVGAVLVVGYFALFTTATNGYGYMGYNGYHHGPSFWHMMGPRTYTGRPSNRTGSLGAQDHTRAGFHGGK